MGLNAQKLTFTVVLLHLKLTQNEGSFLCSFPKRLKSVIAGDLSNKTVSQISQLKSTVKERVQNHFQGTFHILQVDNLTPHTVYCIQCNARIEEKSTEPHMSKHLATDARGKKTPSNEKPRTDSVGKPSA